MKLRDVSIGYIVELLEIELKEPFFYIIMTLYYKTRLFVWFVSCFSFYFTYKMGLKQIDAGMFVRVILHKW